MKYVHIPGGSARRHARSCVQEWSVAHDPHIRRLGSRMSWRYIRTTVYGRVRHQNKLRYIRRRATHSNLQNDAASRINVEVVESVGVVARQSDTGHRLAKGNARAESSLAPELDESAAHSSVIIVVGAVTRYGGVPSAAGQARSPGSGMASGIVVVGVSAVELAIVD